MTHQLLANIFQISGSSTRFPTSLENPTFSWLYYLPISDSVICQMCARANLMGLLILIQDLKAHSCLMDFVGKYSVQNQVFRKYESSLCHKYAVTLLTQPGHVDARLKE